jgi:hypothetical protein
MTTAQHRTVVPGRLATGECEDVYPGYPVVSSDTGQTSDDSISSHLLSRWSALLIDGKAKGAQRSFTQYYASTAPNARELIAAGT